ncbi:MAG: tetratricopeptide repeat protein [Alphaproteobacteria bacterium]|nr:tetratricopeptide repeat protein [Alphaproteobacteria bacterium]
MNHRYRTILKRSIILIALAGIPLSGCTMASSGKSSAFGGKDLQIADISGQGNFTADGALTDARGYFRNNNFGYSAAFYKKATELSPRDPEGYIGLGASYDQLGRFDLSDRVYAALFKITGKTAQYYNNLGYSNMLRGNFAAARKNFHEAEKLDPGNVIIANNKLLLADAASAARRA